MQRLLAIALLTVRAAFRNRLVLVVGGLLLATVVVLPLIIKDDGTARGFTQIVLTYTLAVITALLGFVTIWLATGSLAREVEENQMQMVVVKPIPRWQIWLGKWVGIVTINAILLAASGTAVYALMQYKARSLPEKEQKVLWSEVLVARAGAAEPIPDYKAIAELMLKERLSQSPTAITNMSGLRTALQDRERAKLETLPPDYGRQWVIKLPESPADLKDVPMHIRYKFNVALENLSGLYVGYWEVGDPLAGRTWTNGPVMQAPQAFNEIEIPSNLVNQNSELKIRFINRDTTAVLFQLEDGLEVLYRVGSFGGNFYRGMGIILCWMGFLAALGLTCATFLNFNVAAFCSLGILLIGLSGGTLKQVIDEGGIMGVNHETGFTDNPTFIDKGAVPVAKAMLSVLNLVKGFSPIDQLSTGRVIAWSELGRAIFQIWVVMAGLLAVWGIFAFSRRELGNPQGNT